jgi:omega-6 fatty acid desaturase (delta-12 desaturase)
MATTTPMLRTYLHRRGHIPTSVHPFVKRESSRQLKPSNVYSKADFILIPYIKSSNLRAIYQIFNTLVPYILLWIVAVQAVSISLWLLPPVIALLILFSLRCFSLMHDCGHYSLFQSKRANRIVGFLLGVINAIPQYGWSRDHAYHHKTNGDWERYRGVADLLSTEEFSRLDPFNQRLYEVLRHPLMGIPGGFFYLVIKPRFMLIMGIYDFIHHVFTVLRQGSEFNLAQTISTHQSKHWQSATEFWDLLLNNICVIGGWIFLSHLWGVGLFWSIYSITLSCSATIFIWVFFVQHIFEGAYAHKTAGWDYVLGAVKGSSYLELPTILRWFTADIGYHNIHHLSERIPNYHLAACHRENSHLLSDVKTLRIGDLLDCAQFLLWDADSDRLVSIASLRQATEMANLTTNCASSGESNNTTVKSIEG